MEYHTSKDALMAVAAPIGRESGFSVRASRRREWTAAIQATAEKAIALYEFNRSDAWTELQELSSNTEIDSLYPNFESAVYQDGVFVVPGTVDVTLNYGSKGDHESIKDSYPVDIIISLRSDSKPVAIDIENIKVDTSSFYS